MTAGVFLAPAVVLLGVWIVYPTIWTIIRSFFDRAGDAFVGFDNYSEIFSNDTLLKSVTNNLIWVAIVPALVTALGLIFAVLTERVSWGTAFKLVVFMPIAISLFAAGISWRIMLEINPDRGAVNAAIAAVYDEVRPPGPLTGAQPSGGEVTRSGGAIVLGESIRPGQGALLGLTGIRAAEVPERAGQAVQPEPIDDGITGVVWRDFKPGGGEPGVVEADEVGLPGVTVEIRGPDGASQSTTTGDDGTFRFEGLAPGDYRVGIGSETFRQGFDGVSWLGASLVTISCIIAYTWVWAGFAMVVIAAGLAALPRDLLEAARTDGANEWQVFRRITVPLLAPVLTVVFITMLINVLKVFDIVLAVAPASVQDDAAVIALSMWRVAFTGTSDFGLGSAISVLLFVLVIPILVLNIRRFRREG
ncbi:ABC transporter permease subunit [Miltoncostaea marina]|uniref:ABC transporter permease n=1 Tax=Miltoncostaea marina TaxID=2843215 RepID=UPI001C3DAFA7|nr:ABC transporter permease subunit [Miltoncostaea marina]